MLEIQKKLKNSFYVLLSLPATGMGFGLAIQIAVLSWILKTQYNLDYKEIGIIWSAGPLAGIVGQVIIGIISDKVWFWGGRRRPFIIIGGILAAIMLILLPRLGLINEALGLESLVAVAITVALTLDLAINVSFNPTRSLITDVTPEGNPRTKGYTWMQTISGFFGVFAYVFGGLFGNFTLIYVGSLIILAFSIIPIFFIEEPRQLDVTDDTSPDQLKPRHKADWGELLKVYAANGASWIGVQTMFVFIIAFISQKINPTPDGATQDVLDMVNNKSGQIINYSFAILNTVGFILPALVLEPLTKKMGRIKVQAACVGIMSIGYFLILFFGHSALLLYFIMGIVGIGWAAIVSLPFAIMSEKADKMRMGFFMGIFNLSIVIPQLIVSYVIGHYVEVADNKSLVFLISGAALAVSAVLWILVKEDVKVTEIEQG